jgi:hypothetical protein
MVDDRGTNSREGGRQIISTLGPSSLGPWGGRLVGVGIISWMGLLLFSLLLGRPHLLNGMPGVENVIYVVDFGTGNSISISIIEPRHQGIQNRPWGEHEEMIPDVLHLSIDIGGYVFIGALEGMVE